MSEVYAEIARLLDVGRRGAVATVVAATGSTPGKEGAKMLVRDDGTIAGTIGGGCVEADVWALAREVAESEQPRKEVFRLTARDAEADGLACGGTLEVFIEPVGCPTVLLFGAGHIAKQVAPLAGRMGFRTVVIDDRERFANRDEFPTADRVVVSEFGRSFDDLELGPLSAIVIVTRGHRHDQLVLSLAARPAAGYVGMIGRRAEVGRVLHHLLDEGVDAEWLSSVHTPIGLDIGAQSPEEIALSIVAELVSWRRRALVKGDPPGLPRSAAAAIVGKLVAASSSAAPESEAGSDTQASRSE